MRKLTVLFAVFVVNCLGHREHRIHNIVLYPEKHSWCTTTPIQQVISSPGYESVTIDNNVCVGACFSYSIPETQPAEPGELLGPYCDSCQPSQIACYHVNLKSENGESKSIQKRVQIIQSCSCMSCEKVHKKNCEISNENTVELPQNLFTQNKPNKSFDSEEVPDLLEVPKHHYKVHPEEDDLKVKKEKWSHWFKTVYNGDDQNDSSVGSTNNTKLDELFEDQKKKDVLEKHRAFVLEHNADNNAKIKDDLIGLPESFGLEGTPSHHKGRHIGMGIQENLQTPPVELPLPHHRHYLGEKQVVQHHLEHLVKGPHGSMVLEPVEKPLSLDVDLSLNANSEGTVISYENHHQLKANTPTN